MNDRETARDLSKRLERAYREIAAHEEYENLLIEEINDFAGLAFAHGFRSQNVERGKACRAKIKALKEDL